ncbi:hypothetical protein GCM10022245_62650 [Streptomyces mayteni]
MTRSGAFGDAEPPRPEQAPSVVPPAAAAATPRASRPKERRPTGWLLVDILVLDFLAVRCPVSFQYGWSNW